MESFKHEINSKRHETDCSLVTDDPFYDYNTDPLKIINKSINCVLKKDFLIENKERYCLSHSENYKAYLGFEGMSSNKLVFKANEMRQRSSIVCSRSTGKLTLRMCFDESDNRTSKYVVSELQALDWNYSICCSSILSIKRKYAIQFGQEKVAYITVTSGIFSCSFPKYVISDADHNPIYELKLHQKSKCPNKYYFSIASCKDKQKN